MFKIEKHKLNKENIDLILKFLIFKCHTCKNNIHFFKKIRYGNLYFCSKECFDLI